MSVISRSVSEIFVSIAGGEREFGCTVVDCMSLRGVKCLENVILFTFCCTCSSVPESSWNPHGTVSSLRCDHSFHHHLFRALCATD